MALHAKNIAMMADTQGEEVEILLHTWWNKAPSASMWPRWNLPNCATRDYTLS
jgi:hypothetical protein